VYWIWQMLDFKDRRDVHGTGTFLNIPPSPNVTVEDTIDILPHAPARKLKDLMNSVGGTPFCYVYV
jgi:tyrosinase